MDDRIRMTFLILVLVQALHSIEEYFGKLWQVFAPARFLTGLVSRNLETGFLIINIGLFVFGLLCWFVIGQKNEKIALGLIWFWVVLETINGIGHIGWTLSAGTYTPGIATAPILPIVALYLTRLF